MQFTTTLQLLLRGCAAAALSTGAALAENYRIDETHSSVQFKASHLGYSYVTGRFNDFEDTFSYACLLYTSPSPRDATLSRMPSSA